MEDLDSYNERGRTKLMEAADSGDLDEVKRLLDLGADPFITDGDFGTSTAKMLAGRKARNGGAHKKIEKLLREEEAKKQEDMMPDCSSSDSSADSSWDLVTIFYLLGFVSLILAPFTGVTVVTAAAFFAIGYILSK